MKGLTLFCKENGDSAGEGYVRVYRDYVNIGVAIESCKRGPGRGKKATCAPIASQCNMSFYK